MPAGAQDQVNKMHGNKSEPCVRKVYVWKPASPSKPLAETSAKKQSADSAKSPSEAASKPSESKLEGGQNKDGDKTGNKGEPSAET